MGTNNSTIIIQTEQLNCYLISGTLSMHLISHASQKQKQTYANKQNKFQSEIWNLSYALSSNNKDVT